MALEISARGIIKLDEKGKQYLHVDNPEWWGGELFRFSPDTAVVVTIKKWYKKRSLRQNSLFWAYVSILADYFGYSQDTMKLLIGLKWLKTPIYDRDGNEMIDVTTGEVMYEITSTTALNTAEMAQLCDEMREWALSGWSVVLPLPEDNLELNFKTK